MFEFVLRGDLSGDQVPDLEHAWTTAKSILNSRAFVLDVSGLTHADPSGLELLSRMRNSGVQLTATRPPQSECLIRSLHIPMAPPRAGHNNIWVARFLKFAGICG